MTEPLLSETSQTYDNLIAGEQIDTVVRSIVLLSGQNLKRGAVIGEVGMAAGTPVADGGNTGDGTLDTVTLGEDAKPGDYTVTMTGATTFTVHDPEGNELPVGADLNPYTSEQINFDIDAGGTPFVSGDKFTVPVEAGSGKYVLSAAASVDGSEDPDLILAEDGDASAGDLRRNAYEAGVFNENALTLGAGHTVATVKKAFRTKNIILKGSVEA